eukprot:SAG11_NODE_3621_length_2332_cov_2.130766_3_plen_103_part_00
MLCLGSRHNMVLTSYRRFSTSLPMLPQIESLPWTEKSGSGADFNAETQFLDPRGTIAGALAAQAQEKYGSYDAERSAVFSSAGIASGHSDAPASSHARFDRG